MLNCQSKTSIKRNLLLTTIGIGLQTAGTICLVASGMGISRKISQQMRKTRV